MERIIRFDSGELKLWQYIAALCALAAGAWDSRALTVAWNANTEPDIAGYYVHYQPVGGQVTRVYVTGATSAALTNLAVGTTYSFYVTAQNTAGLESDPSTQITYTVTSTAGTLRIGSVTKTVTGTFQVNCTGTAGKACVVEACSDLGQPQWVNIGSAVLDSSGSVTINDTATGLPLRFYRVYQTN